MISKEREKQLNAFCKNLKLKFKDFELLEQAFHHRSSSNEGQKGKNNERLEFLGDSVLGMVTAAFLYNNLENPEGDLAKIKSTVVSEKALAPVALEFGIDKLLVLGHGEELSGGRKKPAILADCMEAIIGAYYLDSGYKAAEQYVLQFIQPAIENVLKNGMKDFKTQLQEFSQKEFKLCPEYILIGKSGPEHAQIFKMSVKIKDQTFGPQTGNSKKEAEQKVAEIALKALKKD